MLKDNDQNDNQSDDENDLIIWKFRIKPFKKMKDCIIEEETDRRKGKGRRCWLEERTWMSH